MKAQTQRKTSRHKGRWSRRGKTGIKLTESLAAPLLESTRLQYEQKISQKEADIGEREAEMRTQQEALVKAQNSLQEQVEAKLKEEREKIVAEEAIGVGYFGCLIFSTLVM